MGGNLAAFLSRSAAEAAKKDRSAQVYDWTMLLSKNK